MILGNNMYSICKYDEKTIFIIGKKYYQWDTTAAEQRLTRIRPVKGLPPPLYHGNCWLFDVVQNPRFTRGIHMSLVLKPGKWEAYLLSAALPEKIGDSCSATPTNEHLAWPHTTASS